MHKFCVNWAKQKSDMFSWGVCMQSRECVSDLTVPVVLRRTEAARLWVTPTKLVPSTSTIRSFTRILQTQTEYSARVKMNRVFVHQSPQDNKRTTPPPQPQPLFLPSVPLCYHFSVVCVIPPCSILLLILFFYSNLLSLSYLWTNPEADFRFALWSAAAAITAMVEVELNTLTGKAGCVNVDVFQSLNTNLKLVMTQALGKEITITYRFCQCSVELLASLWLKSSNAVIPCSCRPL